MKKSNLIVLSILIGIVSLSSVSIAAEIDNACPSDITVSCDQDYSPLVSGYPILDAGFYEPNFWDEVISNACPKIIVRHWTSFNDANDVFTCSQTITIVDSAAPEISIQENLIYYCTENIELPYAIQDCDVNTNVVITWGNIIGDSSEICPPGTFRSQTQGGWGTEPSGNNPGTYLHAHFAQAFPDGLTIGCNNSLFLGTAQDVTNFLPSGSSPFALPSGVIINPGLSHSNVLAGQLVAATLSTTFDAYDPNFGIAQEWIGDLTINTGTFQGMTLSELLQIANEIIGGCSTEYSYSQVNEALTLFNENFVDGTVNNNYLQCGDQPDLCALFQTYTISATDQCGNNSLLSGTVQLADDTGPEFPNALSQITVDCSQWPLDTLEVTDPCGISATIVGIEETEYSGICLPVIQRIYYAMDACGNQSEFIQYIQLVDTLAPIAANIPQDLYLSCTNEIIEGSPTFSDNCDNALEVSYAEQTTGYACDQTLTRTWTATDLCNNSSTISQTVFINDSLAPTFTYVPENLTLACGAALPESIATAVDNCSSATITYADTWIAMPGVCEMVQRNYIATDACGNSANAIQNIYFVDDIAPVLNNMPADISGNCDLASSSPLITAADNCSNEVAVVLSETQSSIGCTTTITRIWTATDDCGNQTSHTQTLILTDDEPPQFDAPSNVVISCSAISGYTINATDNCSSVNQTYTDFIIGSGCNMQIIRTWSATDACNNSSQFVQTIQLQDTQSPVFTYVPQSYSISCGLFPSVQNAAAIDNCSSNLAPVMIQTNSGTDCIQIITRTWTVTDNCGNTASASQTITITDNVNPVFVGVPGNVTISCGQVPVVPAVTAIDNCSGNLDVDFTESTIGVGCDVHIVRMWSAIDFCGNDITATQHIYIDDNTAPSWSNIPASLSLGCNAPIPPVTNPVASDNCSGVTNTFFFAYMESVTCGQVLHRLWQATDACGNTSEISQTISFLDSTGPTFTGTPEPTVNVTCGNIPTPFNVQATDNCGNVSIVMTETIINNGCPYTLRRTWIASDNCGNQSSFIQNILVSDNDFPVLMNVPANITITCGDPLPLSEVSATDNCSGNLVVVIQDSTILSGCEQSVLRTFKATDLCGNVASATQIISFIDNTMPILNGTPSDIEVECSNVPAPAIVTALDACEGPLDVAFTEEIIDLNTELICALDNAHSIMGEHAFWLPGLDGISIFYTFIPNTATISINDMDGTAYISGELQNTVNPDQRWIIQMYLINKRNWSEWSALGRSYKDDLDYAGNNYTDWMYYELAPTSTLTGSGLLAGSQLNLTHAPASYYYGFQLGNGANNRNAAYGMSGWLDYNGTVNGASDAGHGDFYSENSCCPEQQIIRQWSATDCSGNTVAFTQQIHVTGSNPILPIQPTGSGMEMEVYYNATDRFMITLNQDRSSDVTIEYFDNSGKLLGAVDRKMIASNITMKIQIEAGAWNNGMYLFRARNGSESVTQRAMKVR